MSEGGLRRIRGLIGEAPLPAYLLPGRGRWLLLVLVLPATLLFAVPMFGGLDRVDLENDEAIYSRVIERILDSGEWSTLAYPHGRPFLEKPPLKFWLVAAGIKLGLPRDEVGFRLWDPVMAWAAMLYVMVMAWRVRGSLCAFAAAFFLMTHRELVLDHGLRSNNMESILVLAYCGGIYHFERWSQADSQRARRLHLAAVAGWFAFAFLGKFVAALPLLMVLGAIVLTDRPLWRRLWEDRTAVVGLASLTALVVAPWFLQQRALHGSGFWRTIYGDAVQRRFTSYLDPDHLQPWWFYLEKLWAGAARARYLPVLGVVAALWPSKSRSGYDRILALWFVLPVALLSSVTSKLYHYVYPFLAPLAIWGGVGVVVVVTGVARAGPVLSAGAARSSTWIATSASTLRRSTYLHAGERLWVRVTGAVAARPLLAATVLGLAAMALSVGLWIALNGPLRVVIGPIRPNWPSPREPLTLAFVLALLGSPRFAKALGRLCATSMRPIRAVAISPTVITWIVSLAVISGLSLVTFARPYRQLQNGLRVERKPISGVVDCLVEAAAPLRPMVFVHFGRRSLTSPLYYYFERLDHTHRARLVPDPSLGQPGGVGIAYVIVNVLSGLADDPQWAPLVADSPVVRLQSGFFILSGRYRSCAKQLAAAGMGELVTFPATTGPDEAHASR